MTASADPHRAEPCVLGTARHETEVSVFRPGCQPTSAVTMQIVRVDGLAADGAVLPGCPELVVEADQVPLTVADVDALVDRLTVMRRRMLDLAAPDSPDPKHRAGGERP